MIKSIRKAVYTKIPTQLTKKNFNEFFLPYLSMPKRGPKCKIEYFKIFNYILKILYTGMQWKELPIDIGIDGNPEIHYTSIYKKFASWSDDGSLTKVFDVSVKHLFEENMLDISVLNGDGSNTVAKKGGDGIGYSGHKKYLLLLTEMALLFLHLPVLL
jgi:transposase